MTKTKIAILLLYSFTILLMMYAMHKIRLPDIIIWRYISNASHIPIFGIAALLILWITRDLPAFNRFRPITHYLISLVCSVNLALFSEIIQILGPRDADIGDLVRDIIGIVVFLGIYATFDSKLNNSIKKPKIYNNNLIRIILPVIIIIPLIPGIKGSLSYFHRSRQFPAINSFDSNLERQYMEISNADVDFVNPPPGFKTRAHKKVCEIVFHPAQYPGIKILEPEPDWSLYQTLKLDVYSETDSDIVLAIAIADRSHNHEFNDRYTQTFTIKTGINEISISLEDIKKAPKNREINIKEIASILIFLVKPEIETILYFDNILLR